MTYKEFVNNHCLACGGNWTAMLYSGLKHVADSGNDAARRACDSLPESFTMGQVLTAIRESAIISDFDDPS